MTDRELLEAAAKAAGIVIEDWTGDTPRVVEMFRGHLPNYNEWNPLIDDGAALRLAVKLGITVLLHHKWIYSSTRNREDYSIRYEEPHDNDPYAATRRAIVRAAASLIPKEG